MKIGPFRLFESKPIKNAEAKVISGQYGLGDNPEVTFAKLIEYHDCTPQIQIGVTSYAELITGTEMQVNADDEECKKIIEEWNVESNFYDKFEGLVNTLLITGNAIFEKLGDIEDVAEVDMKTIVRKKRDEFGNTLYYEQQQQGASSIKLGQGNLQKFIEFNLSSYSREAWGKSLFYALAKPRTVGNRTLKPLVEILWAMEDAMSTIMVNHAYPIRLIHYPSANDAELEKHAVKWQKFKAGDSYIGSGLNMPTITYVESQETTGKYTDYVNFISKTVELGIKFPHDILTGDFTSRASSETTENIVLKLARGFQRYL
ncbi:MAG: hypothetical protein ACRD9Q_03015, partial [Nitrososphaeraceae archaeon]